MMAIGLPHYLTVAAVLFTLGLGTRVTSFITWFAAVNYVQRDTIVAYGVVKYRAIKQAADSRAPQIVAGSMTKSGCLVGVRGNLLVPPSEIPHAPEPKAEAAS